MSDETARPRPQFGEYATPEEQRARIRQPGVAEALAAGSVEEPVAPVAPVPVGSERVAVDPTVHARGRLMDRILTIGLLVYGLFNVVTSIPAFVDYAKYAETILAMLGTDATLADPAAGRPWGIAAAILLAVGWFVTAGLSWLAYARGRVTWWIPLVGGIVFTFASAILMTVPLMSDPGVQGAILQSGG